MNKKLETDVISKIIVCDFKEASILINPLSYDDLENLLLNIGYDYGQSIIVYAFVCYLIEQENNTELHFIAQSVLCGPLSYIEGAYVLALYHNKIILNVDKNNIKAMTMMLFFHTLPKPLVNEAEANEFAKRILRIDPSNATAIQFINTKGI